MCGLSGYTGSKKADPNALRVLLLDNEIRGTHATGLANVEGEIEKWAVHPATFMMWDDFDRISNSNLVLVHNRWSTMKNTDDHDAAHPFKFDNDRIIGAHNGFIPKWEFQAEMYNIDPKKLTVDSELFYHHLIKHNYNLESLSEIEGACALSWIDTKTKMLWLYRRTSRPLFIGEKRKGELFYSSREDGLLMLGVRGTVELEPNIAYAFREGELVKMVPIPEPLLKLPMDCTKSWYQDYLTKDVMKKLKITNTPKPKSTVSGGSASGWNGKFYDPYAGHSAYDNIDSYADAYTDYTKKKGKQKKINVSDVIGGRLEDLVSLSVDNFDNRYKDLVGGEAKPSEKIKLPDNNTGAIMVVSVRSSIDLLPISDAIVFIDTPDSNKFLTTKNGAASIRVPDEKIGGFFRVGLIPFPYNRLYYSALFNANSGEVLEVSLACPFRSADRADLNLFKGKKEEIKPSKFDNIKSVTKKLADEVFGKAKNAKDADNDEQEDSTGSDGELQSELEQPFSGETYGWGGTWTEDNDEDESLEAENAYCNSGQLGGGTQPGLGEVDAHGFLTKSYENDFVTIYDKDYISVVEIELDLFKTYVYEWNKLSEYNVSLVDKYTDTSWGYLRFCGNHPYALVKKCVSIVDSSDYMKIEDILTEAKALYN
jgi:hypothetical protein